MSDSTEESNVPSSDNRAETQGSDTPSPSETPLPEAPVSPPLQPGSTQVETVPATAELTSNPPAQPAIAAPSGPLSLERIRQLRMSQQASQSTAQRGAPQSKPGQQQSSKQSSGEGQPKPSTAADGPTGGSAVGGSATSTATTSATGESAAPASGAGAQPRHDRGARGGGKRDRDRSGVIPTPDPVAFRAKIAIPSRRQPLSQDLEQELNEALGGSDLDKLLVGDAMLQIGHELTEGQRIQATVMKAHGEFVFVALGGANEGMIPALSFETLPAEGDMLDVVVRGYLASEGLYELTVPGNAVDVSDWSDLNEGEVVEAIVTAANAGGLECKVGHIQGFIPASQAAEYRIETLGDLVGQKLLCVVTEANPRRGNLVLSHRAVMEREKKEKRAERLASLEIGSAVEGVVRKILDFGAFVDIGGLDGLLHVSQLSWERVKHPSEILEEGQKIQVRIDKLDEATGKISLSYRSLQEHPWENIDARFPAGTVVHGSVTRIAEFGAFVRIAIGVEGLIHISELAHHRVQNVANVVQEGQEVDVKVLAVDPEQQRISLSLKGAQAAPEQTSDSPDGSAAAETPEEPRPEPVLPKHRGPLKGGTGNSSSGEQFGLKW